MKIVITAGGTSERIDNVRKITNSSSGKLGKAIAEEIIGQIKDEDSLYYVCSKGAYKPNDRKVNVIEIENTNDLEVQVRNLLENESIDYFIHSMAVSDYTTSYVTNAKLLSEKIESRRFVDVESAIKDTSYDITGSKISSNEDNLIIVLKPTPKIISIIKKISPKTHLIGFKLLDGVSKERLIEVAKGIRDKNDCDLVVANDLSNIRKWNHRAYIIDKEDNELEANGKEDIAKKLTYRIFHK